MNTRKNLLVFILVGGLTAASTYGQDFTISGIHYNITSVMDATEKTVEIGRTSDATPLSSCHDGNLVLSSTVTNPATSTVYTITSIANNAFFECTSLMSITLPNSVTSIGNGAFGFL